MKKQEQKKEAIERMKLLNIYPQAIKEFETEDRLNLSEHCGILYWLDEDQAMRVRRFEEKYKAVVYHVIHNFTECGEMLTYLYVSSEKSEWKYERADLKDGCPIAYVENLACEEFSEFGSVGIKSSFGGLIRTA